MGNPAWTFISKNINLSKLEFVNQIMNISFTLRSHYIKTLLLHKMIRSISTSKLCTCKKSSSPIKRKQLLGSLLLDYTCIKNSSPIRWLLVSLLQDYTSIKNSNPIRWVLVCLLQDYTCIKKSSPMRWLLVSLLQNYTFIKSSSPINLLQDYTWKRIVVP